MKWQWEQLFLINWVQWCSALPLLLQFQSEVSTDNQNQTLSPAKSSENVSLMCSQVKNSNTENGVWSFAVDTLKPLYESCQFWWLTVEVWHNTLADLSACVRRISKSKAHKTEVCEVNVSSEHWHLMQKTREKYILVKVQMSVSSLDKES